MSKDSELPIDSLEEFLRRQKLVEWPETLRTHVLMPSEHAYNSVEEVEEYFKAKVPFPVEIATSISDLIDEVWERVKDHDAILSQAIKPITDGPSITEDKLYQELLANALKKLKEQVETVPLCPDIMDFKFPGLSNLEHTDIPGLPNASQHLDSISEVQGFNPGFLKIWKPFFLSECSITVFKDTFWWFFLHNFKPSLEDESALFDCISSGFVSLLLMVDNDVKDKLFKVYADCLAQAIYAAFVGAFPQSQERLDDNFTAELAEVTSLWVSGLKPKLLSWKKWKSRWSPEKDAIKTEDNTLCASQHMSPMSVPFETTLISDRMHYRYFQTDLNERIANAKRSSMVQSQATDHSKRSCCGASSEANTGSSGRNRESHYIGPGPQFDHICFKPWGQSPLVARYLQLHGIPSMAGSSSRRVQRTEVATVSPEEPTYQEMIRERQGRVIKWRQKYKQGVQQTNKEMAVFHKEKLLKLKELQRIQMQLSSSSAETKIFSESILNRWDHATDTTNHRARLEPSAGQRGDSDDGRNTEESPRSQGEQA